MTFFYHKNPELNEYYDRSYIKLRQ